MVPMLNRRSAPYGLQEVVLRAAGPGLDDAATFRAAVAAADEGTVFLLPDESYLFKSVDANNVCVAINKRHIYFVGKGRPPQNSAFATGTQDTTDIALGGITGSPTDVVMFQWHADKGTNVTDATSAIYGGGLSNMGISGSGVAQHVLEVQGGVRNMRFDRVHLAASTSHVVNGGKLASHTGSHAWHYCHDIHFDRCIIKAYSTGAHGVYIGSSDDDKEPAYQWTFIDCTIGSDHGWGIYSTHADDVYTFGTSATIYLGAGSSTATGTYSSAFVAGPSTRIHAAGGVGAGIRSSRGNLVLGLNPVDSAQGIPTIEQGAALSYVDVYGRHNLYRDMRTSYSIDEDFLIGTNTSGDIGAHRWKVTGGTASRVASESHTAATISSASQANPTVITTTANHNLRNPTQTVVISGSNTTPSIDGTHTATVTSLTTFTIPVNVTSAGSAGSVRTREHHAGIYRLDTTAVSQTLTTLTLDTTYGVVDPATNFDCSFVFRSNLDQDFFFMQRVGLGSVDMGDPPVDGIFLHKKFSDGNWQAATTASSVLTETAMRYYDGANNYETLAVTGGHWLRLRIFRFNDTEAAFQLWEQTNEWGAIYLGTSLLPLPTAQLNPFVQIWNQNAGSRTMDVDAIQVYVSGLDR